ncbi:MAG: response regulator [Deltaproteobacteria bacterium]|nr:response regulator [Deltaproteobacteria bacterium]MBW1719298.1 response regulator [Deltaproteobacteria bacterium]MBW1932635.1 response regulator [Deltaproteobacteria bacterium]MBW1938748.1 response regulator [Deltaproteobacteria bacterium]MBW1964822.1 response regulator [Deltaproteobacteria bacterium]
MKPRILIMFQDSFFLNTLADKLRRRKMSVLTAEIGNGVLEIPSGTHADVVFLDARYRGKGTMQALSSIKREQPDAEIILISSPDNIALSMQGMREGASDDITAPFDIDTLIEKVREALARKKTRSKTRGKHSILKSGNRGINR